MLMPAIPLMIALFVAFAAESIVPPVRVRPDEVAWCLMKGLGALAVSASVAMGLGLGLTAAVRRRGSSGPAARRGFLGAAYAVQAMNLVVYTWLIFGLGWPDFVRSGLGLRGTFVIEEILILSPFLVAEVIGWWGLYPAARAARLIGAGPSAGRYLVRKTRMTFGMVLPAVVVFWAGNDFAGRIFGESSSSPGVQVGVIATMGTALLILSPALVRLTWPARPLPPGPLRDRLERLARRFKFRYTDILIWDTQGSVFNAVVTGATPWFRYVLLSDALVEHLDEHEVAAVFGHEMGHIHHRHLAFFGFFFLGSLGVMALVSQAIDGAFSLVPTGRSLQTMVELGKSVLVLGVVGVYYWLVFGALSRRFERQADVFGCRAVSCGREDCPPHADYYGRPDAPQAISSLLCPVGIRICAGALEAVAAENGVRAEAPSWRHGSIARRIDFLRGLQGRPVTERRFQDSVVRLRALLALLLLSAIALAWLSGAFETLRGV